jgi:hypothetical protein
MSHSYFGGPAGFGLFAMFFALDTSTNPNRAPAWVFVALGIALMIVLVILFFMVPIGGDDFKYRSTDYYSGPFGGFGSFGGFGGV